MAEYKLQLVKNDGFILREWDISTEYDFDIEDLKSEGKFDFYTTEKEMQRLGIRRLGEEIGEEIVREIAVEEEWGPRG